MTNYSKKLKGELERVGVKPCELARRMGVTNAAVCRSIGEKASIKELTYWKYHAALQAAPYGARTAERG